MNQSGTIAAALLAGFVLYLAARDRLKVYAAVLWGNTEAQLPSHSPSVPGFPAPGATGGGAGGSPGLSLPGLGGAGGLLGDATSLLGNAGKIAGLLEFVP